MTKEEMIKIIQEEEARIFTILNTKRKKLTKLDEIRAGVIWKQPEALWVQEVLLSLNLKVDGLFGSDDSEAKELKGFYQFYKKKNYIFFQFMYIYI